MQCSDDSENVVISKRGDKPEHQRELKSTAVWTWGNSAQVRKKKDKHGSEQGHYLETWTISRWTLFHSLTGRNARITNRIKARTEEVEHPRHDSPRRLMLDMTWVNHDVNLRVGTNTYNLKATSKGRYSRRLKCAIRSNHLWEHKSDLNGSPKKICYVQRNNIFQTIDSTVKNHWKTLIDYWKQAQ